MFSPSHRPFLWGCLAGALVLMVSLLLLALAVLSAMSIGGDARGPGMSGCQAAQETATPTSMPTGATTSSKGGCVPATGVEASVVQLASLMAQHLFVNPACGARRSPPDCYTTWYDAGFPQAVIDYGNQVCPGCAAWANGNYQCVSFVRGAYSTSFPMAVTNDAFLLWETYQHQPGWMEVAATPLAQTPSSALGIPWPGDVVVMKDATLGHVAIVTAVSTPNAQGERQVTFAQANSPTPFDHLVVNADLIAHRPAGWSPDYVVWGYLRPAQAVEGGARAGSPPGCNPLLARTLGWSDVFSIFSHERKDVSEWIQTTSVSLRRDLIICLTISRALPWRCVSSCSAGRP